MLSALCPYTCHSATRSQSTVKPGRKEADVSPDFDRAGSASARGSGRRGRRRTSSNCATRPQLSAVVRGLRYIGSRRWRMCQTGLFLTDGDCQRRNVANLATLHHRGSAFSAGKEPENNKRGSRNVVQCFLKHTSVCGLFVELSFVCIVLLHCSISPAGCKGHKVCDCWTARDVIHPGSGHYITGL